MSAPAMLLPPVAGMPTSAAAMPTTSATAWPGSAMAFAAPVAGWPSSGMPHSFGLPGSAMQNPAGWPGMSNPASWQQPPPGTDSFASIAPLREQQRQMMMMMMMMMIMMQQPQQQCSSSTNRNGNSIMDLFMIQEMMKRV